MVQMLKLIEKKSKKEIDQLALELTRIANDTEFNTQALLNGEIKNTKFHIGANENQDISLKIGAMDALTLGVVRDVIDAKLAPGAANISNVKLGNTVGASVVNGASIEVSVTKVYKEAKGTATVGGITVTTENNTDAYNGYTLKVSQGKIEIIAVNHITKTIHIVADVNGGSTTDFSTKKVTEIGTAPTEAGGLTFSGIATGTGSESIAGGTTRSEAGLKVTLNDGTTTQDIVVAADATAVNVTSGAFQGIFFKSDDLENAFGTINITSVTAADLSDPDNVVKAVASKGIDVSSQVKAISAITKINDAIEKVSAERSMLGAMQNRLEHTIKNLDNTSENLQAAESRIRDADMAKEMMKFTKQNILQQGATAMLAQANSLPQRVLQLLR